jgi:cysteine desulfurase/selenocysteine lyase
MPTGAESNRSAPLNGSRPAAAETGRTDSGRVPFDLREMERLANEMFRALPGAVLPGIDPEQLAQVPLPQEAEALRPEPAVTPDLNGHTAGVEATVRDLIAGGSGPGSAAALSAGAASSRSELQDTGIAPAWASQEASAAGAESTEKEHRALNSDPLVLNGEPLSLEHLGLAGMPRGMAEDPFATGPYFLEEASRKLVGGVAEDATAHPSPTPRGRSSVGRRAFDAHALRREFPALAERVHGRPLIWLDNAATTQKPAAVIDRLDRFYRHENSNIHRAAHEMAARATDAYEEARATAARLLNAASTEEIVFVRGTTEAINLVAQAWGRANVGPGDEILITWLEHHSNIVPWQQLCQSTGATLRVAPVDDRGQVMLDEYERLLSEATRIVSLSHVSNALGTITPVREMTEMAHRHGARVLVDGAQAVSHMSVDVQSLDCDWYAFSGHKVFGPTGVGVLHGKGDLLNAMPPWQGGGNMIRDVTFEHTAYQSAPERFEAGTASIADAVGLGAALEWVLAVGLENISHHEHELLEHATSGLLEIPGLRIVGMAPEKAAVLSFVLEGCTPEEVGVALDREGIAVRAGHHCAQPILRRLGHEGTVRASLAPYNTREDVDALIDAVRRVASHSVAPLAETGRRLNGRGT